MKTAIKFLVAAVILNAAGRSGLAAWRYYELRDAAQQAVTFGATEQTSAIESEVLRKAAELDLPLAPENVSVRRNGIRTEADVAYTQGIEVFPRYQYPVTLSFKVDAVSLTGLK